MNEVEKWLADQRAAYDHLCARGKLYIGSKRPKGFRQMRRKECFSNSQIIATLESWRDRGWSRRPRYVEGLCTGAGGTFAHGWLTLDGQRAIDVTLPDAEQRAYFGIEISHAVVRKGMRSGFYQQHLTGLGSVLVPPQLIEAAETLKRTA